MQRNDTTDNMIFVVADNINYNTLKYNMMIIHTILFLTDNIEIWLTKQSQQHT